MREILPQIDAWRSAGVPVALATVVKTWGSAPRREGAKMAVSGEGEIAGSVSGGCVEGAVAEAALTVIEENRARLLHFGVADETAWEVGLACGGSIEVFVEPLDDAHLAFLRERLQADRPVASVVVLGGDPAMVGQRYSLETGGAASLGELDPDLVDAAREAVRQALAAAAPSRLSLDTPQGTTDVFIDVLPPPPTLVMVGGVHIAMALAELAKALGYRTVVVDPRRAFGSQARFPHVDRLLQAWPSEAFETIGLDASTAVATLTHDPKIDDPALQIALPSQAFYVGALGSEKTQAERRRRLRSAGIAEDHIARLHGPIGLDLGGQTPEEIALAVMAQIVAVRHAPARAQV